MSTLSKIVTYIISNAGTPQFMTPDGKPVTPTDKWVVSQKPNETVIKLTGTVRKGNATLKSKVLLISAEKYRRDDTRIIPNPATNTITVTVAEFAKGRQSAVRAIDPNAEATKALMALFGNAS